MEVVFHIFKPMSESKFCSFPAISLLAWVGRGGGGGDGGGDVWGILKLKLTKPQVELEAWAELGHRV